MPNKTNDSFYFPFHNTYYNSSSSLFYYIYLRLVIFFNMSQELRSNNCNKLVKKK